MNSLKGEGDVYIYIFIVSVTHSFFLAMTDFKQLTF